MIQIKGYCIMQRSFGMMPSDNIRGAVRRRHVELRRFKVMLKLDGRFQWFHDINSDRQVSP